MRPPANRPLGFLFLSYFRVSYQDFKKSSSIRRRYDRPWQKEKHSEHFINRDNYQCDICCFKQWQIVWYNNSFRILFCSSLRKYMPYNALTNGGNIYLDSTSKTKRFSGNTFIMSDNVVYLDPNEYTLCIGLSIILCNLYFYIGGRGGRRR